MHTKKVGKNLFLIDRQTGGSQKIIASYVLKGDKTVIGETGISSSISNLLSGLKELNVKVVDAAYFAISHVHIDHGGGAGCLLKLLPNAKVIAHPRGVPHLVNPEKLWLQAKEVLGEVAEAFGVRNKQSLEEIRERILSEDKIMRKLAGYLKSHPIYVKTVLENSVQGFIDFAETAPN